jgi:2-polyprenyl-3-methyl-5-hydroxy-6-metoxy-1,4-benzoquinol methylase
MAILTKPVERVEILLGRQSAPKTPSLENRVAYQWEGQLDNLSYRNSRQRDDCIREWLTSAVKSITEDAAILDVGCAYGNLLLMLHAALGKRENVRLIGVDLYQGSIDYARAFASHVEGYQNCRFQLGDLSQGLSFRDGSFDAISLCDVLEHMDRPEAALRELSRIAKPGATIVISTPLRDSLFKKVARWTNLLTGGLIYRAYYKGKDTEVGDDGEPVMITKAGNDHVSEMSHRELLDLARSVGLNVEEVRIMSVMSGSRWFDQHPIVLSALFFLEAIHDILQFPSWGHSVLLRLSKPAS